jgi:hypothetical protein
METWEGSLETADIKKIGKSIKIENKKERPFKIEI